MLCSSAGVVPCSICIVFALTVLCSSGALFVYNLWMMVLLAGKLHVGAAMVAGPSRVGVKVCNVSMP